MITCPRCGCQAPDGTPYCPRCGYGKPQELKLNLQQNYDSMNLNSINEDKKAVKSEKQGVGNIKIFLILLSIFSIIGCLFFLFRYEKEHELSLHYSETITAQDGLIKEVQQTTTAISNLLHTTPTVDTENVDQQISSHPTSTAPVYQACASTLDYWTYIVENDLGASGTMTLDNYYYDTTTCKFILQGKSNTGLLTVAIDKYDSPYNAQFEMDCSDPNDIDILIDWAAAVTYYLDMGPSPNYIKNLITNAISSGYENINKYHIAIDKRSDPIWRITIEK